MLEGDIIGTPTQSLFFFWMPGFGSVIIIYALVIFFVTKLRESKKTNPLPGDKDVNQATEKFSVGSWSFNLTTIVAICLIGVIFFIPVSYLTYVDVATIKKDSMKYKKLAEDSQQMLTAIKGIISDIEKCPTFINVSLLRSDNTPVQLPLLNNLRCVGKKGNNEKIPLDLAIGFEGEYLRLITSNLSQDPEFYEIVVREVDQGKVVKTWIARRNDNRPINLFDHISTSLKLKEIHP